MWNFKAFQRYFFNIYKEIRRFHVGYMISFGRGMHSIIAIDLIFEKNLSFIIIHHPAQYHENRSITFWFYWKKKQNYRHTDTHTHADENNTSPKTKFLVEVTMTGSVFFSPVRQMSKTSQITTKRQLITPVQYHNFPRETLHQRPCWLNHHRGYTAK